MLTRGRSGKGSKPAEIKDKCIETLRQAAAVIDAKAPGDAAAFKAGCDRSASTLQRHPRKVDFLALEALKSRVMMA